MRKNQISIKVERFGDQVPKNIPSTHQTISVYADSNNFSEALFEAIHLLMKEIEDNNEESLATGCINIDNMSGSSLQEDNYEKILRKVRGYKHEASRNLEVARKELRMMEHAEEICHIAASSTTRHEMEAKLMERFDISEWEAPRWLDLNLGSISTESIEEKKREISELEERYEILQSQLSALEEI